MTCTVVMPFNTKSGEVRKGQIISLADETARSLILTGKLAELKMCPICHEYAWWLSMYGVLVCGVCHPPPGSKLVKRWIGDPGTLKRMKATRSGLVLSYQEIQQQKATREANLVSVPLGSMKGA
jgi:hypothetical protein